MVGEIMIIKHLTKQYTSQYKDIVTAVDDVTLSIDKGDFIAILGVSGSGKTTLMNCMGGFDQPTSGQVILGDIDLHHADKKTMDHIRKSHIGYFFQDNNLIENLTVYDNIALPLKMMNHHVNKELVYQVMQDLSIEELKHRFPNEISAGQRQRVALARTIVKSPKLLLADEPTGALDSQTAELIMTQFEKMNEVSTIILITHDEKLAYRYAKRVIKIKDGKVVSDERVKPHKLDIDTYTIDKTIKQHHLSFFDHFKLAFNDIKYKKAKSILSMLLTMFALLMVSFSAISSFYDEQDAYIQTVSKQNGIKYLALEKNWNMVDSFGSPYDQPVGFTLDDLDSIKNTFDVEVMPKIPYMDTQLSFYATKDVQSSLYDQYAISGISEINSQILSQYGFDLIYGRLPEVNDQMLEIVLTDYHVDMIIKYGFNQIPYEINSYDDLVNQEIIINDQPVLIVGIIDTHLDDKYEFLKQIQSELELTEEESSLYLQFQEVMNFGLHHMIFTYEGFLEDIYRPLTEDYVEFHGDDRIMISHPDMTINRFIDSFYHEDAISQEIYYKNHTYDNYMVISISSLPKSNDLYNLIDMKTNELLDDFVNDHFDEIKDQFESNTGKNTKEDYLAYIISSDDNIYHPGKTLNFFRNEANEITIPQYLIDEEIIFHSYVYTKEGLTEIDIPVVGITFDHIFSYAFSDSLFQTIKDQADTGIGQIYVENGLSIGEYHDLLTSFQNEGKSYQYQPEDIYMNGLNKLEERLELMGKIFFFGMIGLILFSIILYYQMISSHIDQRMKDIGIFKSLGISNNEIYHMFIIHALCLSLVSYVIHVIGLLIVLFGFNRLLSMSVFVNLKIYGLSIISVGITLVVALLVPLVSAVIPLYKLGKKAPVDIIRTAYRN